MAQGIVDAASRLHPDRPIVTCIRGTGEIEAVEILEKAGFTPLFNTEEAVREAVKLSRGIDTK
jgi:succinyl-CoA synthetase beta subunit